MRTPVLLWCFLAAACSSPEYAALDQRTGQFGTARMVGDQECFTPSVPPGVKREIQERAGRGADLADADRRVLQGEVCGPPKLPARDLILATCTRVSRAHAEGRAVDEYSEELARQGQSAGICG